MRRRRWACAAGFLDLPHGDHRLGLDWSDRHDSVQLLE